MPTKVLQHDETVIRFIPALATLAETNVFELSGTADGAGENSAMHDFGTGARSDRYEWRAFVQLQATTPALGKVIRVYLKTKSTDGYPDNDDTDNGPVSAEDKLKNLRLIGSITVDEAAANIQFAASGEVSLPGRYVAVVFWNGSGAALTTDDDENGFFLTPIPMESQEA